MGAKLRKVGRRTKRNHSFFMLRQSNFAYLTAKLRKNERKAKENPQKFSWAFPSASNFGGARVT
jgi:hypothetical protein